eukprot:10636646-Alexandrium_andersonii.AAC.1
MESPACRRSRIEPRQRSTASRRSELGLRVPVPTGTRTAKACAGAVWPEGARKAAPCMHAQMP